MKNARSREPPMGSVLVGNGGIAEIKALAHFDDFRVSKDQVEKDGEAEAGEGIWEASSGP